MRILAAIAALSLLAPGGQAELLHPRSLEFPELQFEGIEPQKRSTSQGATIILLEDHELPTVQVSAMFRAGSAYDPPGKEGLADMTAALVRTGGAGRWSGDELDEALDFVAASVSVNAGIEFAGISGRTLTRDLALFTEVVDAVLTAPRFDPEKIEEVRQQVLDGIRRQNDEPGPIARRELKKIIYGAESPWARSPTPASVKAITREDLVAFHARYYRPNHLILGVAGDVEADAFVERLDSLFSDWEPGTVPELPPATRQGPQPGVYLAEKDVNQTTVRMGHLGLPRMHPDYHACLVMNRILGIGTFTSRMGVEIRSNRGLAYSVGSGIFEGRGPGMFLAVAGTKAPSTHEVMTLMKQIIGGMHEGVTEKELSDAKQTLLNQWVFEFDSSAKVVGTKVEHEFYGYPADTLEEYPRKIAAVTRADIQRAARAHLRPADLAVLLVGDPAKFETPLARFGKVQKVTLPATE